MRLSLSVPLVVSVNETFQQRQRVDDVTASRGDDITALGGV